MYYTRGLKQAIGVREFDDFLKAYLSKCDSGTQDGMENLKDKMNVILSTSDETPLKQLLEDAIDKVKLNTRKLVHRQKRRLIRLQTLFGWNIHYFDATKCLSFLLIISQKKGLFGCKHCLGGTYIMLMRRNVSHVFPKSRGLPMWLNHQSR